MIYDKINLLDKPTEHGFMPYMQVTITDAVLSNHNKRPMVIVCPGGGYCAVCDFSEGESVALKLNAMGFCTAILYYRVAPHRYPDGLYDIANAIKLCRENAVKWNIDKDMITVMGFSAAGHLCADISTEWKNEKLFGKEAVENRTFRPNLAILGYPVITSGEKVHAGSFQNLFGHSDKEIWDTVSCEKLVDKDTPPAFIWTTYGDTCVPMENSMLYASALRENGVPFELHIFEKGEHGLGNCKNTHLWNRSRLNRTYDWIDMAADWMQDNFGLI